MSLVLMGGVAVLSGSLLVVANKYLRLKKNLRNLEENYQRDSMYAKIYPIKRVLLRYHKLMEPHEFKDVGHQQARFRGIEGAIQSSERLKNILEEHAKDFVHKTNIPSLLAHHHKFLEALSECNDVVKSQLQETPKPSQRPPCPSDLDRKMWYLRRSLDEYDNCLHHYDVEKCLSKMREIMELIRYHDPSVLAKPVVWEALIRNEHFLVELVNLLPEPLQKGTRTDAPMIQPPG